MRGFTKEQIAHIMDVVFRHFKGRSYVFYPEYEEYLKLKGFNDDEIVDIWSKAVYYRIIDIVASSP